MNKLIAGYARSGELNKAIQTLRRMREEQSMPDRNSFLALLGLCADNSALPEGRLVHSLISRSEYHSDDLVQNATINMYAKCGSVEEARLVFENMEKLTQVSWNSLLAAYAAIRQFEKAFQVFQEIQLHGFSPDRVTFVTVLSACSNSFDLFRGKLVHGYVLESGLESNVFVGTALMTFYGKCGCVADARAVFDKLQSQDVVSWTSMIVTYVQHDEFEEALELFHRMRPSGVSPNRITYATAISACACLESLEDGEKIHSHIVEDGLDSDVVVSSAIVNMYGKCGSVERAREVFQRMPHPNIVSWNSIVAVYTQNAYEREAVVVFRRMQLEGVKPDKIAFVTILTACANSSCLVSTRRIHHLVLEAGFESNETVAASLLNAYINCGSLEHTWRIFEKIGFSSLNACTRMIAAFIQNGFHKQAIELFDRMQLEGVIPDKITLITVFSACTSSFSLKFGERLLSYILERGFQSDLVVSNCIITMFSECGRIEAAAEFFSKMVERDRISWNTIIGGHSLSGSCREAMKLFREMLLEGVPVDKYTFMGLIDGIKGPQEARFLNTLLAESGLELDGFLVSAFLNVHSKYGNLDQARSMFEQTRVKDVVLWTSLITAYVQHGSFNEALQTAREMRLEGVGANEFTVTAILNTCAGLGVLSEGRLAQRHALESGFASSVLVANGILNMFAKCGCLEEAIRSFLGICNRNLVSWNSLIAAYVQNEKPEEALRVFQMLQLEGMKADRVSFVTVLNGCPGVMETRKIHRIVCETGWDSDHVVATSLLNAYSESLEDVTRVFSGMTLRDVISWNSVIVANVDRGLFQEAIGMFKRMQLEGVSPDKISFITVLNAFAGTSEFREAKVAEQHMFERGFLYSDVTAANAVVSMFGRSGRLIEARRVFEKMNNRDLYSWNGIVTAHANHGESERALKLFRRMQQESIKPDNITLTSVLSACGHVGLIEEGYYYFTAMERDFRVSRTEEHFGCVVDLLARSGRLEQAEEFILKMPLSGTYVMWMTLLSACKIHGSEEIGKRAAARVMELAPGKTAGYILYSGI